MKVVAITGARYYDNIYNLPPRLCKEKYGLDYDIIIHHDPVERFDGKETITNYDALINFQVVEGNEGLRPKGYTIPRYNKLQQQELIASKVKELNLETYRSRVNAELNAKHSYVELPKHILIKPMYGARSVSIVEVESSVPLNMAKLLYLNCQYTSKLDDLTADNVHTVLADLGKDMAMKVTYHSGNERESGEALSILKSQVLFIEEYVPNVIEEYRLLVDGDNNIAYMSLRDRARFLMTGDIDPSLSEGKGITTIDSLPHIAKDFTALLNTGIFKHCSVDLFVTDDNKWGVFEFQNQYGTKFVPYDVVQELTLDVIKKALESVELS